MPGWIEHGWVVSVGDVFLTRKSRIERVFAFDASLFPRRTFLSLGSCRLRHLEKRDTAGCIPRIALSSAGSLPHVVSRLPLPRFNHVFLK